MEDIKKNVPFTENGYSYFLYKSFNLFLKRSKAWDIPKVKTQRMLQVIFKAVEEYQKLNKKSVRVWKVEAMEMDKATITETKMKDPAFK